MWLCDGNQALITIATACLSASLIHPSCPWIINVPLASSLLLQLVVLQLSYVSYNYIVCCIALGTIDNRVLYLCMQLSMSWPHPRIISFNMGQHWLVSNSPVLGQRMLPNPFLLRSVYLFYIDDLIKHFELSLSQGV